MTTDRTAIRRRLAVRRTAHRPPWGGRKSGHRIIFAPLAATLAASVVVGLGVAVARAELARRAVRERDRERERTFALLADERAAEGLKRLVLSQLDIAVELLSGEAQTPAEEAVHETRKAIKRLRALMRLLEGEIGVKRARRERAVLRDAAKRLASARDAEVMVDTLEELLRRHPRKLGGRRALLELRGRLRRERAAARAHALEQEAASERVLAELRDLRGRVARWQLRDRPAGRLASAGLERIYRTGRRGHRRVRARGADLRAMHKWRKHVKDLRYALEALDVQPPADPPDAARIGGGDDARRKRGRRHGGGRVTKLAKRADALGEVLGEEHDLLLLAELARAHKPLRRHRRARRRLLRAIARRRARLRAQAMREGKQLYERKPRRFVKRVRAATRR